MFANRQWCLIRWAKKKTEKIKWICFKIVIQINLRRNCFALVRRIRIMAKGCAYIYPVLQKLCLPFIFWLHSLSKRYRKKGIIGMFMFQNLDSIYLDYCAYGYKEIDLISVEEQIPVAQCNLLSVRFVIRLTTCPVNVKKWMNYIALK